MRVLRVGGRLTARPRAVASPAIGDLADHDAAFAVHAFADRRAAAGLVKRLRPSVRREDPERDAMQAPLSDMAHGAGEERRTDPGALGRPQHVKRGDFPLEAAAQQGGVSLATQPVKTCPVSATNKASSAPDCIRAMTLVHSIIRSPTSRPASSASGRRPA